MGKKIKITIVVAVIVLSIPFCMRWYSTVEYYFSDEGKQASSSLKYRLTGTKTVEVAGLERFWSGEVIIPEKTIYCGYLCTVTSIGKDAFYGCSRITSVKIPTSVTEIGSKAFSGCSGLTSVKIPSSVTEIGNGAFYDCSGLTSVVIPSSVKKIGDYAFRDCSGLTSVEIPMSVREIGEEAFENCIGLTNLEIPTSVEEYDYGRITRSTRICSGAFKNCYNLNIVIGTFSRNVVEENAFDGCKSVTWKKDM